MAKAIERRLQAIEAATAQRRQREAAGNGAKERLLAKLGAIRDRLERAGALYEASPEEATRIMQRIREFLAARLR